MVTPFLILALGGFFCLLVWCGRDNVVHRKPSRFAALYRAAARMRFAFGGLVPPLRRAVKAAEEFQRSQQMLAAALGVTCEEAGRSLQAAMRNVYVETPEQARQRILNGWRHEFAQQPPSQVIKGITDGA